MHIFGVIVWLGGLMFQSAVVGPVAHSESELTKTIMRKLGRRFVAFIWMSVWTMLVTGVLLMLLSPRFVWFHYDDRWSVLLAWKQVIFILMIFYAFGYARMLKYLESPTSNGGYNERAELYRHRLNQFRTISIFLGIVALFLAAAMQVYG